MRTCVLIAFVFFGIFESCVEVQHPFTKLPPGVWRANLQISEDKVIPFNFETSYDQSEFLVVTIMNDVERIQLNDVKFGRNQLLQDTLYIDIPLLDSHIKAEYKEGVMEGHWVRRNREDYQIPFVAFHGQQHRFSTGGMTPATDISGNWQAAFEIETEDEYPAIGEFVQDGNYLSGTFMTETGDYRFLEGEIQGDQVLLSCFDGGHAFRFEATLMDDNTLVGKFFSGIHYETNWIAHRDDNASLTDPFDLTAPVHMGEPIEFTYTSSENKEVSLTDKEYEGKAKLIVIMGTWCPNCLDESRFLIDYKDRNPDQNFEIIAVAFERYRDRSSALEMLKTYKEKLNMPYQILLGGYYDKKEATESFQLLDKIISYPTLLFVNKDNVITKVHTGYNGPATSGFDAFVREFEEELAKIATP